MCFKNVPTVDDGPGDDPKEEMQMKKNFYIFASPTRTDAISNEGF